MKEKTKLIALAMSCLKEDYNNEKCIIVNKHFTMFTINVHKYGVEKTVCKNIQDAIRCYFRKKHQIKYPYLITVCGQIDGKEVILTAYNPSC